MRTPTTRCLTYGYELYEIARTLTAFRQNSMGCVRRQECHVPLIYPRNWKKSSPETWKEQGAGNKHPPPTSHQIPSWYNKPAKRGDSKCPKSSTLGLYSKRQVEGLAGVRASIQDEMGFVGFYGHIALVKMDLPQVFWWNKDRYATQWEHVMGRRLDVTLVTCDLGHLFEWPRRKRGKC